MPKKKAKAGKIVFTLHNEGFVTKGSAEMSEPVGMALYQLLVFGIGMPGPSVLIPDASSEAREFERAAQTMFEKAGAWLAASKERSSP